MKTVDHKTIGKRIIRRYFERQNKMERNLFLMGCVLPDINPFTYIKGSVKYQALQGHNFLNAQKSVKRYIDNLTAVPLISGWGYYSLGQLVHYITDAFTFPHNIQFQDSAKAHLRYENDLHKILTIKPPTECRPQNGICECARAELFDYFTKTHLEYIEKRKGMEDDLNYIEKVLETIMTSIMERGETHE